MATTRLRTGRRYGVRVLEADPGLGFQLDPAGRESARLALVASALKIERGPWEPTNGGFEARAGDLGVLVVRGYLLRDVHVGQSVCAELVGKGEVLRPWAHIGLGAPVPSEVAWTVLEDATIAYLDRRFLETAAQWPEVVEALTARAVERAQSVAVALAIAGISGLPSRMLALLWTLADRFGRVASDGVRIDVALTQSVLARLVGASRQSVSSALKRLEREGRIARSPGGGYVLYGDAPAELGAAAA